MSDLLVTLRLSGNADGAVTAVRLVKRETDGLGDSTERAARRGVNAFDGMTGSLKGFAKQAAASALAAVGIGGAGLVIAAAVGQARDFGQAMAEVSTVAGDTSKMAGMTQAVRDLAKEYGQAPTAQAKALYEIISAGISDTARATETLEAANRLALGGITEVETAADGLTTVLNSYGAAAGSAAEVSDRLFVAALAGKTTIGELSASIGNAAPIAAQTGVSIDELLSSVAALTLGGVKTTTAVDGIRATIAAIIKPSKEATEMAAGLGLQFDATALKSQGLAGFLKNVEAATGGSADKLAVLFGGVEALAPVMSLTGNQADAFAATLDSMANSAGVTDEAVAKMADTAQFQFARLKAEVSDSLLSIGESMLTVLVPAAKSLADNWDAIGGAVDTMVGAMQTAAGAILLFAGVRGVAAAVTALQGLRQELVVAGLVWKSWGSAAAFGATGADAFGARMLALAGGPVVVAATALGLLAIKVKSTWDEIVAAEQRGARSIAMARGSIGSAGLSDTRRPLAALETDVERLAGLMLRDSGREQALARHHAALEKLELQYRRSGGTVAQWNALLDKSTTEAVAAREASTEQSAALQTLNKIAGDAGLASAKLAEENKKHAAALQALAIEEAKGGEAAKLAASIRAELNKQHAETVAQLTGATEATKANEQATREAAEADDDRAQALRRLIEQQQRAADEEYSGALINSEDAAIGASRMVDALRDETAQAALTREELQHLAETRQFDAMMRDAQLARSPEQLAALRAEFNQAQETRTAAVLAGEAAARAAEDGQRAWTDFAGDLIDAMGHGMRGVKDLFANMLKDLARQLLQSTVLRLMSSVFGGSMPGLALAAGAGGQQSMLGAMLGGGGNGGGLIGGGAGGLMQYAPALAALAGGAFGLTNRGSSNGSVGSIGAAGAYGYAGYAAGTVAYGAALGASGAVAGGATAAAGATSGAIGAAGAIPVAGWIIAAIAAIDMITGGKVFGTRYRAESGTTSLNIGADGGDASQTIREVRQRALFGGRQWRNRNVDASDEATEAAQQLFDSVRGVMSDAARALNGDAPAMIDAALRTVVEYDKKGKVKATKYFVDLLGRTWEEATAEAATQRIMAESMIATIDSILGTTAEAAGQSAADATGTVIDAAAGAAGDAIGQAGANVFDTLVRKVGDAQGEASTIAERWRDDAALLMDGAQMLLAAAVDIRKGSGLLGEGGTLTQIADLIGELQAPGEALVATYQRVSVSAALFDEALALSGVSIDKTREDLVRLAVDITEAAGGLDRAQALWSAYFQSFFTEAERADYARNQAQARAASQAGDIGLNLSDFTGTGGMQAFRDLFEQQMPTLTADAYVQWLEFAEALATFVGLSAQATDAVDGVSTSLTDLMSSVTEQLEQYAPPQSFAQRLQAINVETDTMIAQARALGATEEQLGQIRALSAARLGEVLDEQAAAMLNYQSVVQGINDELADARGLSEFQREMREINRWFADTTASLNDAARAAGLQGAAEQDLAAVHELAAIRAAQAIARLEESGRGLVDQLYGTPLERLNNELENMWNGIGGMGASTAAGMNQVTEATDNAIQAQIGAQQRIRDWLDGLMASDLGGLRPRDAMAEAQALFDRTLQAALGGDADAMGQLPQLADQLLRLGQRVYASGDPYFDLRDAIRAALEQVAAVTPVDPTGNPGSGPTIAQQVASVQGPFGGNFFGDAGPAATSAAALDARAAAERRALAGELAGVIRDLVTSAGRPLDEIEETLGFSMADLVSDLGVNLNALTAATATQLADIAQSTGTELSALAASVGVDLGSLANRQSLLNDALEAEVSALPPEQAAELEPMLRAIEDAAALGDTEGVEEGIAEMEAAINGMSPAIRDALAPYFEGIRPPDPATQIGLLGSISGELASHTGLLAGILAGIGSLGAINEPDAPSPWVGPLTPGGTFGGPVISPPGYAVGTPWVPADGLAYLHRGEAVIPARVNAALRGAGVSGGTSDNLLIAELRELRRERREADEYTRRLEQRLQQLEATTARGDDAKVRAMERQTDAIKSGARR